jgi:hypothetical protein
LPPPTTKLGSLLSQGRSLLNESDPIDAHRNFEDWVDDVTAWLETELANPSLAAMWSGLPYSALVSGDSYYDEPRAWAHFRALVSQRMTWLGKAIGAQEGAPSESRKQMPSDEISPEGRKARFDQWEKLGLDEVKNDLASGGHRLIGGPPQVRALAREWVRVKEAEAAPQLPETTQSSFAAAPPTYARETVIAAADMLKALGHTGFNRFLLEINLSDNDVEKDGGLLARATSLAKYAINNPTQLSPERRTIPYEIIRRATALWQQGTTNNLQIGERERFEWNMKREGQERALTGEYNDQIQLDVPLTQVTSMKSPTTFSRKVFIVHGRDEAPREAVARFLEKLGFEAIILHEQANKGRTVIEKVEAHGDVGFAVVLLTPDDEGCTKGEEPGPRARQNVILELGYFIGRLGRERVCALKRGEVEIPSDFGGVVYEPFDSSGII